MKDKKYLLQLVCWLLVFKACMAGVILYGQIHLAPDEAQYWTWSEALSYGYYSKPPGIAWQIALGTFFFGNTEFGVRFGALLISFLLPLAIYGLGRAVALERKYAFWAALSFALTPLSAASSLFATTDGGYLLFWTAAAAVFVHSLKETDPRPRYFLIALLLFCGALFKWTTLLLWIPIVCFSLSLGIFSAKIIFAILLSLAAFLPSILWNWAHDFATFRHVFRSVSPVGDTAAGNPIDFIAAQVGLFSPIIFVLFIIAFFGIWRVLKKVPRQIAFCWWVSALFFGGVFFLSCFKKVQGNWAVGAYPTAFIVLLSWLAMQKESLLKWLKIGSAVSVALLVIATLFPVWPSPWKEALGWNRLPSGLKKVGYSPEAHFLFSDRYQMTSLLSFYSQGQKRAYFLNIQGLRKNQFCYWPGMEQEQVGKNGLFVKEFSGQECGMKAATQFQKLRNQLLPYFTKVSQVPVLIPLYEAQDGKVKKVALVIHCEGYNGTVPPETEKY